MIEQRQWATEDFDSLSWHDVHVHGFRLDAYEQSEGAADLLLDIDFILSWHESDGGFQFTICPATLRFKQVFGLQMTLDYVQGTAGMCPFSIHSIERRALVFQTGYKSYDWHILLNWPDGNIKFQAPGFTLTLTGAPRISLSQWLNPAERQ